MDLDPRSSLQEPCSTYNMEGIDGFGPPGQVSRTIDSTYKMEGLSMDLTSPDTPNPLYLDTPNPSILYVDLRPF